MLESRVVPRTMPMPVSSQERLDAEHERVVAVHADAFAGSVGCSERSGSRVGVRQLRARRGDLQAHHDRVDVVGLVVAAPHAELLEAEPAVEPLRRRVVGAHLEEHLAGAALARLGDQGAA